MLRRPLSSTLFPYTTLFRSDSLNTAARELWRALGLLGEERTYGRLPLAEGERVICRRNDRSEEHTSELQSRSDLVCRLLLEKKKTTCWFINFSEYDRCKRTK